MPLHRLANSAAYIDKIRSLLGGALIGYWPLNEASGATAFDVSGNARNGTYTSVTLGQPGIGDGGTAPSFDGSASFVTLPAALNGQLFSLMCWGKVQSASVWTDGVNRNALQFFVDGNNNAALYKDAGSNQIQSVYVAGSTAKFAVPALAQPTSWFHMAMTVTKSGDALISFFNGVPSGPATSLGSFAGSITQFLAGVTSWKGYLAHVVALNRVATPAEILAAASLS